MAAVGLAEAGSLRVALLAATALPVAAVALVLLRPRGEAASGLPGAA